MSDDQPTSDLCRLLYTSRTAQGRDELTLPELIALSERASHKNARAGITGSLLFVDGQFIQILEGPAEQVEETFECICRDFRHRELHLVDMVTVKERIFPEWGMACLAGDSETRIRLNDELKEIGFLVNVNANQAIRQMRALLDLELQAA